MEPEVFWLNVKSKMGYMRIADLARASGVSQLTLSRQMRKKSMPSAGDALSVARALNCKVEDLLDPVTVTV